MQKAKNIKTVYNDIFLIVDLKYTQIKINIKVIKKNNKMKGYKKQTFNTKSQVVLRMVFVIGYKRISSMAV